MSNPGNSGQRYKMPKCISVEIDREHGCIVAAYECGHECHVKPMWGDLDSLFAIVQKRIGKRARCDQCLTGESK